MIKKIVYGATVLVASGTSLLAQEGGALPDSVSTAITDAQSFMEGLVEAVLPVIAAIALLGLGIWAVPKLIRYIKAALR